MLSHNAPALNLKNPRVMIIGCGSIGGVVSGRLIDAGVDVLGVTNNASISQMLQERGLEVAYDDRTITCSMKAVTSTDELEEGQDTFDVAVLSVPPDACEQALRDALPWLKPDAPIVCLPNGLVEERLARLVDPQRLIGGVVGFGGARDKDHRVRQTSGGGFVLGRLHPERFEHDEVLEDVAAMLSSVGPIQYSDNLRGARWSKLAINCAISSLGTIGGDRLGVLMRHRYVRRLALDIMTEVVAVAHAEDVRLEKVAGTLDLDWIALNEQERDARGSGGLVLKHTVLLAVGAKFRKMRSSMLSAIERGRTPSVDFLNGEVTDRAKAFGVKTPVNDAVQRLVHSISEGHDVSSMQTLRTLYDSLHNPEAASQAS